MARGDQLARQWMIFQQLMTSRYGKTVNDLAADLDCHPRTVYRDLDALQVGGFPIYNEKVNGTKFWVLMESAKKSVPKNISSRLKKACAPVPVPTKSTTNSGTPLRHSMKP